MKCCVLTKKLDETGARLELKTEIAETPCTRDQHYKTVSSQSDEAA
jgi:hypothetical protein